MLMTTNLTHFNYLLNVLNQFYSCLKNLGLDLYDLPPLILIIPILVLSAKKPESPNTSNQKPQITIDIPTGTIAGVAATAYLGGKAIDKGYTIEADGLRLKPSKPSQTESNSCNIL